MGLVTATIPGVGSARVDNFLLGGTQGQKAVLT